MGGHDGFHDTVTYGSSVQLLNVTHPLGGAGRTMAAGQYEWPIVFALPPGLPSSFRLGSGSERCAPAPPPPFGLDRSGVCASARPAAGVCMGCHVNKTSTNLAPCAAELRWHTL